MRVRPSHAAPGRGNSLRMIANRAPPAHLGGRDRDARWPAMQSIACQRPREPPAEPLRGGMLHPTVNRQLVDPCNDRFEAIAPQQLRIDVETLHPAAPGRNGQARPHGEWSDQPEALLAHESVRRLCVGDPEYADVSFACGPLVETGREARQGDPPARSRIGSHTPSAHVVADGVHRVQCEQEAPVALRAAPHLRHEAEVRHPLTAFVDIADEGAAARILLIEPAQVCFAREHGDRKGIVEQPSCGPKIGSRAARHLTAARPWRRVVSPCACAKRRVFQRESCEKRVPRDFSRPAARR